jgi:hypothetical protein
MRPVTRSVVLLVIFGLGMSLRGEVPAEFRGDWLLVNGVVALSIREDGTMMLRNSGATGVLTIGENGDFVWKLPDGEQSGKLTAETLLLKNDQPGAPAWMQYLEFRRASNEQAAELIEFALRQQNQMAGAFERVRRTSMEKAILNNLRQLAAAADQYFLEEGVRTVSFDQIVGPDKYIRSLPAVDGEDYRSLDLAASAKTWTISSESGIKVTYER